MPAFAVMSGAVQHIKDNPMAPRPLADKDWPRIRTQYEHTDKQCGNWPLANDSRVKDAFWPELQNAVLGRKDARTALADAERRVARELRRA